MRTFHVYILASWSRALYHGVTNDLRRRVYEHKTGAASGHTSKYRITRLVYYETYADTYSAIAREKQLKRWPRERKMRLIERFNPDWRDLSNDW